MGQRGIGWTGWLPLLSFLILLPGVAFAACGGDDDDDDDDQAADCAEDDPLEITGVEPASGFNLKEQELTVAGGCFDTTTTATLVADDESEIDLDASAPDNATLAVTVPAGIPVGSYTLKVTRGELTAEAEYAAVSDIIVSGAYEGKIYIVDMADPAAPSEFLSFEPWPGEQGRWTSHPSVNYQGNKVYFADYVNEEQSAIYLTDLLGGGAVTKITDDSVPYFHTPDASPTSGLVTFLGCEEVSDVCDIYTANEDGTNVQMIADHEDLIEVGVDTCEIWGLWEPVFSPDGTKIAYMPETHCIDEEGCENDWYSVVMVMNADGSNKQIVAYEPQVRWYDHLHWTFDDFLVWKRADDDVSPQEMVAMKADGSEVFTIEPPDGAWDSGWNGGGDGFVWLAYGALDDAIVFQPFNTNVMYYYPLTMTASSGSAGDGWSLDIDDGEGGTFAHYSEFDWFGWQP